MIKIIQRQLRGRPFIGMTPPSAFYLEGNKGVLRSMVRCGMTARVLTLAVGCHGGSDGIAADPRQTIRPTLRR